MIDAAEFAARNCCANDVKEIDRLCLTVARDELGALSELTNYWDVIDAIPSNLSANLEREFLTAVRRRCVEIARGKIAESYKQNIAN